MTRRKSYQFSSVTQSCPTLCDPMNCSTPGLPVHHQLPEFTQTPAHRVGDAIGHFVLCRPLLLLPLIPPSIRVFSNEFTFRMKAKSKKDLMMHGQYMKFRFQCSQIKFVETQSPFPLAYLCIYCLCCFYIMTTGLRSFCRGLLAGKD